MSEMDINMVLAQMRAMASSASADGLRTEKEGAPGVDFGELMRQSLDEVNKAQTDAKAMATAFESGQEGVELPEVMIALQRASISFQAITQVRNKLLTAYQEVMNMQV